MSIVIDNKFEIGDFVYLVTDAEQAKRLVVSICVNKYDILYEVIAGTTVSKHYDFELQTEKSFADI